MSKPVILLADDEPLFGKTTARYLSGRGYEVRYVGDGSKANESLAHGDIDLVIADLDMPGNRNLELIHACRRSFPDIPFIIVTGRPSLPSAIEGIRLGVHDYFLKPLELEDLLHSIRRALRLQADFVQGESPFSEILGTSHSVLELKALAQKVSRSNASVLIRGQSGTGKELLARGIHNNSQRRDGPFVTVDCASIPDPLFESILFGHAKGAFTGAISDRDGLIVLADRGTLFLDEVGELPLGIQAKLLRVLQFGTFLPVGQIEHRSVDVRIVAATHRDLKSEVTAGRFRLDLYYRLAVLEIVSPPLKNRKEDIGVLAKHFLSLIAARDHRKVPTITPEAVGVLESYEWPGNIRELANVIERCVCLSLQDVVHAEDILCVLKDVPNQDLISSDCSRGNLQTRNSTDFVSREYREAFHQTQRQTIESLLRRHRGNVSRAAKEAKMTRQGFHKAMTRLGIQAAHFRA